MDNMTALVSCFSRCYHTKNSNIKIYDDQYAEKILTEDEYNNISNNMANGIKFFNQNYEGNNPLKWIVNNQLAPSVLARSAFNERHLLNEIRLGLKQYMILASGYDTSAYKVNKLLNVYELDRKDIIEDKKRRISKANINNDNVIYVACDFNKDWIKDLLKTGYDVNKKTVCSLLGISYYLDKDIFKNTIKQLSNIIPSGSAIIFDYPNDNQSIKEEINKKLAASAKEEMKSNYTYRDIEKIAEDASMLIYENLNYIDIDNDYFYDYNTLNPNDKIKAPIGIEYCLMVKK